MSWILGSTTIPEPKQLTRNFVEKSTYHEMVNGSSKKDVTSRKEQFKLIYTRLSQDTIASILAEFALKQALVFSAESGELLIAARSVHVDIPGREYNTKGSEFREDIVVILTDADSQI